MDNQIEKKNYYNALYGYYYSLLTPKQQEIFEYYYGEDYSLSEIAENMAISRNAVWDALQKACNALEEYEAKLSLYKNGKLLDKYLMDLEQLTNESGKEIISKIKEME